VGGGGEKEWVEQWLRKRVCSTLGSRAHMDKMEPDTVAILLMEVCTHSATAVMGGEEGFGG
jgi:hypothetical protein